MKRLEIRIYGRVQGVGFRYAAKKYADKLTIFGFALNLNDGSLYIEAQGASEELEKFLAWCRKGPWSAKVDRVESAWRDDAKKLDAFEVK